MLGQRVLSRPHQIATGNLRRSFDALKAGPYTLHSSHYPQTSTQFSASLVPRAIGCAPELDSRCRTLIDREFDCLE